ncbi:hypothetical protein [Oricola indica]|uniref:hypothetical protein n=1 Tax=Oricola indica TaxID=2872591 RepID=UPI003CCBB2C0
MVDEKKVVDEKSAKQGGSGRRALYILVASVILAVAAYVLLVPMGPDGEDIDAGSTEAVVIPETE